MRQQRRPLSPTPTLRRASPARLAASSLAVVALLATGCSSGGSDSADATGTGANSEEGQYTSAGRPEETVYGFVQAMAAGDLRAACQFYKFSTEDNSDELPVAATDEPGAEERYEACVENLTGDIAQEINKPQPGSEPYRLAAEIPIEDYEISEDPAFDEMQIFIPGDWDTFEDFKPFWELHQLDTNIIKFQDDDAWYLG